MKVKKHWEHARGSHGLTLKIGLKEGNDMNRSKGNYEDESGQYLLYIEYIRPHDESGHTYIIK